MMERAVATLTTYEFEALISQTIDQRLEVWLTQLMDALLSGEEEKGELRPEFVASLKQSLQQAQAGQVMDLTAFREQLQRP